MHRIFVLSFYLKNKPSFLGDLYFNIKNKPSFLGDLYFNIENKPSFLGDLYFNIFRGPLEIIMGICAGLVGGMTIWYFPWRRDVRAHI